MRRSSSWQQMIYYGEVVGFLAAWAVGIVIALGSQPTDEELPREPGGLAVVSGGATPPAVVK